MKLLEWFTNCHYFGVSKERVHSVNAKDINGQLSNKSEKTGLGSILINGKIGFGYLRGFYYLRPTR